MDVQEFTVPAAGTDTTDITIEESYSVEGVGEDTVTLTGTLSSERAVPLIDPEHGEVNWETSTIVARFTHLDVRGSSDVFGPVRVHLDTTSPAFGVVTNAKCKAALPIVVSMPEHDLLLRSAEPIQLSSTVRTVPPIGDESTVSLREVQLVDRATGRVAGTLTSARVLWRELTSQIDHYPGTRRTF